MMSQLIFFFHDFDSTILENWQYRLWIIQLMSAPLQEDYFVLLTISEKLTLKKM